MTHKEIIELFIQYEKDNPVEAYRCYDWNVWPLLRITTSYDLLLQSQPHGIVQFAKKYSKELLKQSRLLWRFNRFAKTLQGQRDRAKILTIDSNKNQNLLEQDSDVVILTFSGRRQQIGSCLYEIYADPLSEYFEERGVSTLIWERSKERWPRCSPSVWISRLLAFELFKRAQPAPLPKPVWFADFASFASSLLGRKVSWAETEAKIQLVQQYSLIFEKWLKIVGVRLLVSICWYDPEVMAATLAANRLGVVSADIQHGIQGRTHMAYSGWEHPCSDGYEAVPDVFMCWGSESASLIMADNPAFAAQSKAVVTGNLWFNKWREGCFAESDVRFECLKNKCEKYTKVILITLQKGFGYEKFLIETILRAPADWYWLVRFHPATSVRERLMIEKELNKIQGSRIEFNLTSTIPLFSILLLAQIHLTGNSTSVVEALGFGIPTITLTDIGVETFKSYLAKGVMQQASTAAELLHKIRLCESISGETCRQTAEDIFASSNLVADGVDRLLSIADICRKV